ncbi:hypothetical protein PGT21_010366 [Puccinia graminis f. sp. tritici]|uniref:Uncharacterized protein n=2 Tax=Puccinia graminis f. sp. tritici TaxID=56615 RepID=E3K9L5_PUCGT|nr:uncharacterized protein PGTG_07363 [Puccinia graminis f. sp. tritici CRL 75-36-700-3]EFP81111.2 hypothetical protein PGTG_07363 [Puccinia graminis f. sp. tritici CRL 75-36-700-3]KAA1069056.1 hypothetical protein PGT21_010366 [Puccinia graminis f. sp. tritici]
MSYVHCQHTSADTPPCRCPVWEAPGDEEPTIKSCDTCGHRSEWHLPLVESTDNEGDNEMERCKSSWPNGQPCTCPTWIAPEDPSQNPGCALCGHKKGWHRPTITRASSTQGTPSKMQLPSRAEVFKLEESNWHSRAQSCGTGSADNSLKVRTCSANSWAPGTKSSSASNQGISDPPANGFNSFFTPDSSTASPNSAWSSANPLPTVHIPPVEVQLAAEHMRFILSELDDDEDEQETSFSNTLNSPSNHSRGESGNRSLHNHDRSFSRASQSSLYSFEAPMSNQQWTMDGRSPSPSFRPADTQSIRSNSSSFVSVAMPRASVDVNTCSGSMSFSSLVEGVYSRSPSRTQPKDYNIRLSELDLTGGSSNSANSHLRPPPGLPLLAQTTSETYVEELPVDRPRHPSEERTGRFAFNPTDIASNTPLDESDADGSVKKVKPFQSNIQSVILEEIPVLDQHTEIAATLKPISLPEQPIYNPQQSERQRVESYQTKDQAISLSISPSPSSTTYSPGDYLNVTIQLRNSTNNQEIVSPLEFEQQLSKWKKITFQLSGTVTQNGTTEHEIFNLSQNVYLSDQRELNANKTGWRFKLRIPTHTNCKCGPGHLPLPSSCSNSVGHVSYHLILKGKKKAFLSKASTTAESSLFVGLNLKSNISDPRQQLLTFPESVRPLTSWIGLNGAQKAAITNTLLTYQVEFLSSNTLRILYEVELQLSPDSELSNRNFGLFEELSSNLKVTITSLNQLIQSHANTGNGYGNVAQEDYQKNFKTRDVRSKAMPTRSDTTGLITWKISGYLHMELFGPADSASSHEPIQKKCLMGQLKSYAAKADLPSSAKNMTSQWILRASIQSVILSQPLNIRGTLVDLQSTCAARSIVQGIPLTLR